MQPITYVLLEKLKKPRILTYGNNLYDLWCNTNNHGQHKINVIAQQSNDV